MKKKEFEKREKQGRKSREIGTANLQKLLTHIHYNPSTFTKLEELKLFSKPVLANHLKKLKEKGLIQRRIEDDRIVYYSTPKALEQSIEYVIGTIKHIAPEEPEPAINFMFNNIVYLIAETQKLLKPLIMKNPQNETLKDKFNKLQKAREELLPWLKEL